MPHYTASTMVKLAIISPWEWTSAVCGSFCAQCELWILENRKSIFTMNYSIHDNKCVIERFHFLFRLQNAIHIQSTFYNVWCAVHIHFIRTVFFLFPFLIAGKSHSHFVTPKEGENRSDILTNAFAALKPMNGINKFEMVKIPTCCRLWVIWLKCLPLLLPVLQQQKTRTHTHNWPLDNLNMLWKKHFAGANRIK